MLDYLAEAGIRYVCDWVNDDQPYLFEIGTPPLVSLPYSVQTNDVPAYFEMKVSVPEFEAMLKRQFDTLYREGQTVPRVMAIAVHPFVTGQPHRIGALDAALEYICSHEGVWRATGWEIVQHFLAQQKSFDPSVTTTRPSELRVDLGQAAAAVHHVTRHRQESTLLGHSASHSERLFLPRN
jgi:allantoinase